MSNKFSWLTGYQGRSVLSRCGPMLTGHPSDSNSIATEKQDIAIGDQLSRACMT